MPAKPVRKPIGQLLKEMGVCEEAQIQEALEAQREEGGVLGHVLIDLEYATEESVREALATQSGLETVDLEQLDIHPTVLARLPASTAEMYRVIPIAYDGAVLKLALSDPTNVNIFDDLRFMFNCEIEGFVASDAQIDEALAKFYADGDSMASLLGDLGADDAEEEFSKAYDLSDPEAMAHAAPVVKLLNLYLMNGVRDIASDIHFEPFEDSFRVRYRVDGVLYEMESPPKELGPALVSRVKVMSNLDIAETRMPQDGRIELAIGGKPIDLRVSTLPTMFGESSVLRVLDRSVVSLDLDKIGLRDAEQETIKALIDKPNGIILVCGPTGCGKTTTLYSCLNYANVVGIKIITTEDPVEYDLDGIVQVQVNEEIGVTYAACLRSILRQDPDKILVGEIRDRETAQIAIEASLTGHIVFSTLHTNDAPSAITRMLDIGIEPFLIAATLEAIVAQRLVRRICVECREVYDPAEEQVLELGLKPEDVAGKQFAYGMGCTTCNHSGHRGRLAIFEIMLISDTNRNLIMDSVSTAELRDQARREGMRTLREAGLLGVFDQKTTVEEVLRETLAAE